MDKREELFDKYMNVRRMMGAMRHKRMADDGPMADDTRGRGRVLALLRLRDGISTREMAEVLGIRVSSLNETLARMEADGIVARRQSDEDRRVMLVDLTDAGRAIKTPTHDMPGLLFGDFSDEDVEAFGGYLDRMVASMESELGCDAATAIKEDMARRKAFFDGRGPADGRRGEHRSGERDERRGGCGGRGGIRRPRGGDHGDRDDDARRSGDHGPRGWRHEDAWR